MCIRDRFKETIKANYEVEVGVGHVLLTWIVKHAAWVHNRYQLHSDGKTSYERRWGNNYNRPICEFGETVIFQYATRPSKTISNWSTGIWLGRCTNSDEHYVATKDDVFRTRTIRRLNKSDRYNKELLDVITCTPWATKGVGKQPTDDFILQGSSDTPSPETKPDVCEKESTKVEPPPGDSSDLTKDQKDESDSTPVDTIEKDASNSSSTIPSTSTTLAVPVTQQYAEKRPGEVLSAESSVSKRTRTVLHTTITPVTKIVTKKGKDVAIECNEEKELRLSDPLLSESPVSYTHLTLPTNREVKISVGSVS